MNANRWIAGELATGQLAVLEANELRSINKRRLFSSPPADRFAFDFVRTRFSNSMNSMHAIPRYNPLQVTQLNGEQPQTFEGF